MTLKDLVSTAANFYSEAKKLSYATGRTVLEKLSHIDDERDLSRKILSLNQEAFEKDVGEDITKQLVEILRHAAMVRIGNMTADCAKIEVETFYRKELKLLSSTSWFSFSSSGESPVKKSFDDFMAKFNSYITNCSIQIKAEVAKKEFEQTEPLRAENQDLKRKLASATLQVTELTDEQKHILLPQDAMKKVTECLAIENSLCLNFNAMYETDKENSDNKKIYQKLSTILSDILASNASSDTEKLAPLSQDNFKEMVQACFDEPSPVAVRGGVLFPGFEPQPKYRFYFYACEILKLLQEDELVKIPRNVHAHNLALAKMQAEKIQEVKACVLEKKQSQALTAPQAINISRRIN